MDIIISVFLILGALLAGAMSPGPSFVFVARVAMSGVRRNAIAASVGMGVGSFIFSIFALLGLQAVLVGVPVLYFLLKVLGGFYLVYMGYCIWKGASDPLNIDSCKSPDNSALKKFFVAGLITQVSNPKTAIVYGSIFAALLPSSIPDIVYFVLPPLVFIVEMSWYLMVACVLSNASPQAVYLKSKVLFDRLTGGVMAGLGIKLVSNAGA